MEDAIGRISLDTQDFNTVILVESSSDNDIRHVDYLLESPSVGRIFWSTCGGGIMSASLNGSDPKLLLPKLGCPEGIAVDWTTGNI